MIAPVPTFHASSTPAIHCGLSPALVGVDPQAGTVSPVAPPAAITGHTSCVAVTHNLGHPARRVRGTLRQQMTSAHDLALSLGTWKPERRRAVRAERARAELDRNEPAIPAPGSG